MVFVHEPEGCLYGAKKFMPELPEVETIRLQLDSVLPGEIIKDIQVLASKSFFGDKRRVIRKKIIGLRRFAKILVIDLSNSLCIAVHLKMTGQLIFSVKRKALSGNNSDLPNKHTRVIITLLSGDRLYFNDLRKFGWLKVVSTVQLKELINKLGPEPLRDLTLDKFKGILKSSNKPVKLLLMDQEKLAGVGNIYANEALFMAGISPTVKTNELSGRSIRSLFHCLIDSLKMGIKYGGASDNNYVDAFGEKGHMQEHFEVYGRTGEKCFKCPSIIKRIKIGGRGTFYCPTCQR